MPLVVGGAHPDEASAPLASLEEPGRTTGEMSRFRSLATRPEPQQPDQQAPDQQLPRLGARPISRTAEMPELAGRVPATLPTPDRPPPLVPKPSGIARTLFVGLLCAGALAGAGVGVLWLLVEAGIVQIHPDPGPPPPMPKPAPGYKPPASSRPADKP
jgi:hypothetical protein